MKEQVSGRLLATADREIYWTELSSIWQVRINSKAQQELEALCRTVASSGVDGGIASAILEAERVLTAICVTKILGHL